MNNNFPDEDDDILMTKMFTEERPADKKEFEELAAPFSEIESDADLLEVPELQNDAPSVSEPLDFAAEPANLDPLIETPSENVDVSPSPETNFSSAPVEESSEKTRNDYSKNDAPLFQSVYNAEPSDETIRKSGLAYAAAIILFGSIVFTLILGWFADLLLGTSPWGKVGGIILGAVIGFIQFFRTTSQILKDKD